MKLKTFTVEERLSLDRLKQRALTQYTNKTMRKPKETRKESFSTLPTGKEWVNNLLETKDKDNTEFERTIINRFAEWIDKELKR